MNKQIHELQKLCTKHNHRLLDIKFGEKITISAQKINKFTEPKFDEVRDYIDYDLLYEEWVKNGTVVLAEEDDFLDAVKAAIKYFQ